MAGNVDAKNEWKKFDQILHLQKDHSISTSFNSFAYDSKNILRGIFNPVPSQNKHGPWPSTLSIAFPTSICQQSSLCLRAVSSNLHPWTWLPPAEVAGPSWADSVHGGECWQRWKLGIWITDLSHILFVCYPNNCTILCRDLLIYCFNMLILIILKWWSPQSPVAEMNFDFTQFLPWLPDITEVEGNNFGFKTLIDVQHQRLSMTSLCVCCVWTGWKNNSFDGLHDFIPKF